MKIGSKYLKFATLGTIALALALTVFTGSSATAAGDIQTWQKEIARLVAKKQVYPRAALSREIEGRAKVKLTIDRSGTVTNYKILERTGHDVLDAEIDNLVQRIDPLPQPPGSLSDSQLSFILPLAWIIQ